MTNEKPELIPAEDLDAWVQQASARYQRLPGVGAFLNEYASPDVIEVFLDNAAVRRVLVVFAGHWANAAGPDEYRVEAMTVGEFAEELADPVKLVEVYRPYVEHGQGAEKTFGAVDILDLPVPAAAFVRELDALAGRPTIPAIDCTPAQTLATTLAKLVEHTPPDTEGLPTTIVAITDPETGDSYPVRLSPWHVENLTDMLETMLRIAAAVEDTGPDQV
ncbi:hypothetical protein [Nonomuraea sp. NPDC023979]|uniref:hypothetical protein n=1 Tax=Nonomuraea sp. NPDC023979 TaxID=3154796 RepID=UPI003402EA9B